MAEATFSLDLHVLSPPLTFALSQDQTLRRKFEIPLYVECPKAALNIRGEVRSLDVEWFLLSCRTKPIICDHQAPSRDGPGGHCLLYLAIQFSETDPAEKSGASFPSLRFSSSSVSTVSAVEGCCLYGVSFDVSTVIEKISVVTATAP